MRVLIFGGTGFVGLNIAHSLLEHGHSVTLFDCAELPAPERRVFAPYGERLKVLRGDVTSRDAIEACAAAAYDAFVLGAAITAGPSREAAEPERILAVNVAAQIPILEAARRGKVRRVINLSSAAAYGASGQLYPVLEETTPCDPQSLYAITKFASERVASRLADLWQIDVVNVRLSGVFGPFERIGGVRDTPSPQALIVDCCARGVPALLGGPGEKDWIYAPDAAEAVVLLLEAEWLRHALYNISGSTFSAEAWGRAFALHRPGFVCRLAVAGETPNVTAAGPERAPLSAARLTGEFGWRAKFDREASAADLDRWLRDQHERS